MPAWQDAPAMRWAMCVGAFLSALACAAGANAHGDGSHSGFAARVSVIDPFLPGLLVQVLGGHERLSVANLTDKRIVILDDRGKPFVRIAPGKTGVWAEPRIGATEEPPEEEGLVRNWSIDGTADGEAFEIVGFLGYRPPAHDQVDDNGSNVALWSAVIAIATGALVAGSAVALLHLRREC